MLADADVDMRQVSVLQVILLLGLSAILMAGIVILALNDKDVVAIFGAVATIGLGVATALGITLNNKMNRVTDATGRVEKLSNGRLDELMAKNEQLNQQVAALALAAQPPPQDKNS